MINVTVCSIGAERVEVNIKGNTHADTCTVDIIYYVEHYLDRHCFVNASLEHYEGTKVPIMKSFYACDG